jgi:hypothetical protein
MKKLIIPFLLLAGIYISACNGNNETTESTATTDSVSSSTMDTSNNNAGSAMVDEKVMDFAKDASTGGMM